MINDNDTAVQKSIAQTVMHSNFIFHNNSQNELTPTNG